MHDIKIENHVQYRVQPLAMPVAAEVMRHAWRVLQPIPSKWVSAGTALGLYRGDGLIEGDTDLDVAMLGFEGVEERLHRILLPAGFTHIRSVHCDGLPMQLAYMARDTIFDIYLHWPEGDSYVNRVPAGKTVMPRSMYDRLIDLPTPLGTFAFPGDIEGYLSKRYGNWRVPSASKSAYEAL